MLKWLHRHVAWCCLEQPDLQNHYKEFMKDGIMTEAEAQYIQDQFNLLQIREYESQFKP